MSSFTVVFSRTLLAGAAVPDGAAGGGVPALARVRDGVLTLTLPRATR